MSTELIKLKNSNPLYKYPTDAEKLNFNFEQLLNAGGATAIKDIIEATGQVYLSSDPDQFFKALTQLIGTAFMFKSLEQEPTATYTLVPAYNGYAEPANILPGMRLSFTPSVTNTDAPKARFSTMLPAYTYPIQKENNKIQPNVLYPGTVYDMVFVKGDGTTENPDHWNIVSSSAANGESDSALMDIIFTQIRNLITAAGLSYNTTDFTLLTKAVSQFVGTSLYDCEYNAEENTYHLTTFGSMPPISSYSNGTLITFMPSSANLASDPKIMINDLEKIIVYNLDGSSLNPGNINPRALIIARYLDGKFLVVNQNMAKLTLTSGPTVNEISNDSSLSSNSTSKLVTESAIKTYVDLKVQSTQENVLLTGKTDEYGNADALHQFNTHCLEIITDTEQEGGSYSYKNVTPAEPDKVIVAENEGVATALNAISNAQNVLQDDTTDNPRNSTLYWSCDKHLVDNGGQPIISSPVGGFAVDGCQRIYNEATSTVERVENTGDTRITTPYLLAPGYSPSFYAVTLKTANTLGTASDFYPNLLKIKHTRKDTTPATIKLQMSVDGINWYEIVDETSEFDANHEETVYKWTVDGVDYYTSTAFPLVKSPGNDPDSYTLYRDPHLTPAPESGSPDYEVISIIDGGSNYKFTASNGISTITCANSEAVSVPEPIFDVTYNYGDLQKLTEDEDGYLNIQIPYAVWNGIPEAASARIWKDTDLTESLLEPSAQLHIKILATYFPHQEYTPEQSLAHYDVFTGSLTTTDPDTHETITLYTERTTWEIANLKFLKKIAKVPAFSIAYPSKNLEILKKQLIYSVYKQKYRQISADEYEPLNEVELLDLGETKTVVLYKEYMSSSIDIVPENLVYVQNYDPGATESNNGALWFNPELHTEKVHVCTQIEDTDTYYWNPIDCILLGRLTINRVTDGAEFTNSIISDVLSYRYGDECTVYSPITALTNQTSTIHHNFGYDVTVSCYLKCLVPELGYAYGDYIALAPGRFSNSTLTQSTSTVIIDGTTYTFLTPATNISTDLSYFDVVDNATDVLLRYTDLKVLNKTTNIYEAISANHWALCVFINKD